MQLFNLKKLNLQKWQINMKIIKNYFRRKNTQINLFFKHYLIKPFLNFSNFDGIMKDFNVNLEGCPLWHL